ncbi:hypothetical protein [Gramella sp. MAR_2010_147]|uniref:hypothetical protein n=1 Tax=Gramella sp. MAR_2010_147 TaxID=1250205 RepID=UPI00087D0250|nr:hypothetical protein [Gramella sp. MAR_2010_147]SDS48909.1 hypothetical protein SAMN04488553_2371 [Gramella sp. MAR_2010_147]
MALRLLLLIIIIPVFGFTQNTECACCSTEYKAFDFWVGNWEVFDPEGQKIGENLVKKLEDNCILNENWISEKGGSGKSYNYYDPSDDTWNQLWISNTGNILKLKGRPQPDKMVLKSEPKEGKNGKYYNQITWTKNPDGNVTQNWEIYDLEGNLTSNAFIGIYKKKAND